jgi:ABC-type transport system involved in multi-copper enzyme maturation permease subunit
MAAVTVSKPVSGHASGRAGLGGVVRSEWTKIRSVRSTYWTLLALVVVGVGISALASAVTKGHWNSMSPADRATFDATATSLFGLVYLGQLIIVVLGALVITSEYSTGMIRTSLTVMPRRGVVFLAKGLVFGAATMVVSLATSFIAFLLGQALLSPHNASLSSAGAMRAVVGSAVYVTLCGLFAYAVGLILRHTAGAITAVLGILFVLPIIVNVLPSSWRFPIERWVPWGPNSSIATTVNPPDHQFTGWGQIAVFGAYVVVLLIVGATLFRKRDA